MKISKSAVISFLLVFIVAFATIKSCEAHRVFAQRLAPTVTVTPTLTPAPAEDASEQVPSFYKEVIELSGRTIETVKWGMTVVLTVITLIVGILGGVTVYRGKVAEDKAGEAHAKALAAETMLKRAEERVAKAENTVNELRLRANELDHSICNAQASIQAAKENIKEIKEISAEAAKLRGILRILDEEALRFLATLHLIDRYRRTLLITGDPIRKRQAEWALLEKTRADSPLVRRESVIALSGIKEPSEDVVERFKEIAAEEDDLEVKKLAEEALNRWGFITR